MTGPRITVIMPPEPQAEDGYASCLYLLKIGALAYDECCPHCQDALTTLFLGSDICDDITVGAFRSRVERNCHALPYNREKLNDLLVPSASPAA